MDKGSGFGFSRIQIRVIKDWIRPDPDTLLQKKAKGLTKASCIPLYLGDKDCNQVFSGVYPTALDILV